MIGFRISETGVVLFNADAVGHVNDHGTGCFVFVGVAGFVLPITPAKFAAMLHHAATNGDTLPAGLAMETVEGVRIYSVEAAS